MPVFNERDNLRPLHESLRAVLDELPIPYELVFIDDGSTDGSNAELKALAENDPRVRLLEFARNFGQTAAMAAGFDYAQGDVIISLDADLQNDPTEIPKILNKLAEGFDVVSGWRRDRKDTWLTRVLPSQIANYVISRVSGVRLHDYGCTLKAYRREIVAHIRLYGELHRFLPILAVQAGARLAEIPVTHHPRRHGRSKYGMGRTVKVILDLITVKFLGSCWTKPMYVFGGFGLVSMVAGTAFGVVTLAQAIHQRAALYQGPFLWASLFFLTVGFQAILLGLLAEMLMRTYYESQNKPIYILKPSLQDQATAHVLLPMESVSAVEEP